MGEKGGHSTYYGHEGAGVPIVQSIFKRLKFGELSPKDKKNILLAVQKHMLVHNLDQLNPKTLSKLILDDSWETIKSVGYADEASRGSGLFNNDEFQAKIQRAEEKVSKLGGNANELRKRIKQYVDGNRLMQWFPELRAEPVRMKTLLPALQEFILDKIDKGEEPTEDEIYQTAKELLTPST